MGGINGTRLGSPKVKEAQKRRETGCEGVGNGGKRVGSLGSCLFRGGGEDTELPLFQQLGAARKGESAAILGKFLL